MLPIKFSTSTILCTGVLISTAEELERLKKTQSYPEERMTTIIKFSFDIEEDILFDSPLIFLDKFSQEKMYERYTFYRLRNERGWVIMELDDPHYGDPEWIWKPLDNKEHVSHYAHRAAIIKSIYS